ncbi:MAG: DUF2497 domain-containing protein [Alphaproteobacteria bacterium]|jgi:cell pole-organizing protein PopZ
MSQATKANEPSMEEILASIRRIIADDEPKPAPKAQAPAPAPMVAAPEAPKSQDDIDALMAGFDDPPPPPKAKAPAPAPAPEPDILDLTEAVAVAPPVIKPIARTNDIDFFEPPPVAVQPMPAPAPMAAPRQSAPEQMLLSNEAHAAVGAAFGSLTNTILSNNSRTLEDLMKDMLRPMLKNWLDDNLPQLVERLVRAEIERVSRGAGPR